MTDREKLEAIRAEIHRLVHVNGYSKEMANELFAYMNSLPNEPVSDDLEKAAEKYSDEIYEKNKGKKNPDWNSYSYGYEDAISSHVSDAFKEGANWQKKQMMKDAVVGHISTMYNGMLRATTRLMDKNIQEKLNIKFGDKVKLIIIKEE